MTQKEKTLNELSNKVSEISNKHALIGFDAFVDKIGDEEKMGGIGPTMADGLLATGQKVKYIGALGEPTVHPVFKDFAERTSAVSLCNPGDLEKITFEGILTKMGEGMFIDAIFRADLIGFMNWEMTPNMTSILIHIIEKLLPTYGPREGMTFFFDLADVSKRSKGDLRAVLSTIKRFQNYGDVLLAFDTKAAQLIYESLGRSVAEINKENVKKIASDLCQALEVTMVAIHNRGYAACATHRDNFIIDNNLPINEISENIYFNIGFVTGFLLRLSPPSCLQLAAAFSEYFLENRKAPLHLLKSLHLLLKVTDHQPVSRFKPILIYFSKFLRK